MQPCDCEPAVATRYKEHVPKRPTKNARINESCIDVVLVGLLLFSSKIIADLG